MTEKDTEQLQHELSSADSVGEYLDSNQEHMRRCTLALAMGLVPKEAQHLLYYAGAEQLYVRNSWDSIIWYALERRLSVRETNELLASLSETEFLG